MACINCDKIRSAILHGRMAEAAGLTLDVFREKMGLVEAPAPADEAPAAKTSKKPA